jgi:hypothetical protein
LGDGFAGFSVDKIESLKPAFGCKFGIQPIAHVFDF